VVRVVNSVMDDNRGGTPMGRRTRQRLPAEIEALRSRLEAYRSSPRKERRLPKSLWTQAAELARQHGVSRVQRTLHLNYYDLKQRIGSLPAAPPQPGQSESKRPRPAFVELGVPRSLVGAATILEVEDRTGRKLTVRLAAEHSGDVVALARAVWGCAP
jgi:hypothetical protein